MTTGPPRGTRAGRFAWGTGVALALLMLVIASQANASPQLVSAVATPDSREPALFTSEPLSIAGQDAAPAPIPEHTGFEALLRTTGADFKAFPRRRSTWVILGVGAAAALASHPWDDTVNAHLVGSPGVARFFAPGKYIGSVYVQAGAAAGLYLTGRYLVPRESGQPRNNKLTHLGFDLIRAQIVSQALVHGIKQVSRRDRPTGECCAFPSGHAASAFATASVLERHFGYRAAWPTLLVAAYVGASRLHDNRHFLSDVMFGSAVGMAAGWTVVGRHGRSDYSLVPIVTPDGIEVRFVRLE